MATRQRRQPINSPERQKELHAQLQTRIQPPFKLTEEEQRIFDEYIDGLPMETWDAYRVRLAATAAKTQCHVQEQQNKLDEEGPIVVNDRGTQIANPRHSVLMQSMNLMQTVWRTLGLSASQRGLTDKKNIGPLQEAEKEAKQAVNKAKANSLIA